jgi:rhamnosyltransferase
MSARQSGPRTNDPRPDVRTVAAVLVTYHPDDGLYERVRNLTGQVNAILIVDNGSAEQELAPVQRLVAEGVVEAIFNGRNVGQAAALNQGLAWGESRGVPWMATFDQDTLPGTNLVEEAGHIFDDGDQSLAVIGAGWLISPSKGPDCTSPTGRTVAWVVTSGALHSVQVWREIGGFRDDFFIDYVDIEYCLRARSAGYRVVRACVQTMQHAIGNPTRHRLLFRFVQPTHHSRVRRYFITRNRIHMWRAFWRKEPASIARDVTGAAKDLVKLLLFETDRLQKLRAMLRGAEDGLRGVTGPLPARRIPS